MKKLNKNELLSIEGGLKLSASLLNYAIKGASFILDLGRSIGTAIRRIQTGKLC